MRKGTIEREYNGAVLYQLFGRKDGCAIKKRPLLRLIWNKGEG